MDPGSRTVSLAVTAALHVAAIAAILQIDAVRKPLLEALPLLVHLVTPPKPEPPPEVIPPKPRPVARQPLPQRAVEPPPILAVESSAPSSMVVPPQPKLEPAPAMIAPAPPAPPRIVPPSFDAAYLKNPPPAYPSLSRRRGEQGTVILRVFVNADGGAEKVLVRTSSGHERLDQAAHDAVHQWRFVPARQGDQHVAAWVLVPIRFALEN
jgi:protein TonB